MNKPNVERQMSRLHSVRIAVLTVLIFAAACGSGEAPDGHEVASAEATSPEPNGMAISPTVVSDPGTSSEHYLKPVSLGDRFTWCSRMQDVWNGIVGNYVELREANLLLESLREEREAAADDLARAEIEESAERVTEEIVALSQDVYRSRSAIFSLWKFFGNAFVYDTETQKIAVQDAREAYTNNSDSEAMDLYGLPGLYGQSLYLYRELYTLKGDDYSSVPDPARVTFPLIFHALVQADGPWGNGRDGFDDTMENLEDLARQLAELREEMAAAMAEMASAVSHIRVATDLADLWTAAQQYIAALNTTANLIETVDSLLRKMRKEVFAGPEGIGLNDYELESIPRFRTLGALSEWFWGPSALHVENADFNWDYYFAGLNWDLLVGDSRANKVDLGSLAWHFEEDEIHIAFLLLTDTSGIAAYWASIEDSCRS